MRVLALLALLGACAPAGPVISAPKTGTTLCVEWSGVALGRIKVELPGGMLRVDPGATECRQVQVRQGATLLSGTTIANGMRFETTWRPAGSRCWIWRLNSVPQSAINLTPCSTHRMGEGGERPFLLPEGAHGFSACVTRPTAWVSVEALAGEDAQATLDHEAAHLRQMRQDPSCEAHWRRVQADPSLRVRFEAEAFCEGAKGWARQNNKPFMAGVDRYASWLTSYGFGLSRDQAAALIASAC